MGGGSKAPPPRPEVQVPLAPNPSVTPVDQPNPPVQTFYQQYYLPPNIEALRQSLMTQNGPVPFGVQSPFRQVSPNSLYAAPRLPQVFTPGKGAPTPPPVQTMEQLLELQRLRDELEAMKNARGFDPYEAGGNAGGSGGSI